MAMLGEGITTRTGGMVRLAPCKAEDRPGRSRQLPAETRSACDRSNSRGSSPAAATSPAHGGRLACGSPRRRSIERGSRDGQVCGDGCIRSGERMCNSKRARGGERAGDHGLVIGNPRVREEEGVCADEWVRHEARVHHGTQAAHVPGAAAALQHTPSGTAAGAGCAERVSSPERTDRLSGYSPAAGVQAIVPSSATISACHVERSGVLGDTDSPRSTVISIARRPAGSPGCDLAEPACQVYQQPDCQVCQHCSDLFILMSRLGPPPA